MSKPADLVQGTLDLLLLKIVALEPLHGWAGRDPRAAPQPPAKAAADLQHVAGFLDAYFERHVRPAGLRSIASICSRIGVLKEYLGELPIKRLEHPEDVNRFKLDSEYADEVEIATLHKVLATLRAAIHWGMAQTPPLLEKSPFHRCGARLNKKQENSRDRRISREEEKQLLYTALAMNTWETSLRRPIAPRPHHRRAGTLLPPRRDADDSEPARRLGQPPDWNSGTHDEGQGEPADPVRL